MSKPKAPPSPGSKETIGAGSPAEAGEIERRRREEERDRLFTHSLDMLCVASFDGYFRQLNPAWTATLGWSQDELKSKPWLDFVHPDDRAATLQAAQRLAEGESLIRFENRYRCKDASYRCLSWSSFPRPEEGRIYAVVRDITARKQAEKERLQVFERISDAFVALDKDWRYTYLNEKAGQMFGRRPEDLVGKHIWTEFPEGVGEKFHQAYELAMATQQPVFLEEYYPPYDRWFENRIHPSPDGLTIYFHDVTEPKKAEQLLQDQNRVLEMIATAAPLADILTSLLHIIEAALPGTLGSLLLLDPDGAHVRHGAALSLPEAFNQAIDGQPIGPRAGSCGTAAYLREPVIVEDIETDPLWEDYRGLALAHGLRACWSTPIFDAHRRVLGTFALYFRQPARPDAQHQRILGIATHIAALAMGREQAQAALRVSEEQLRLFVENAPAAIVMLDRDMKYLVVSRRWLSDYNLGDQDLVGRSHYEVFPDLPERWKDIHQRCLHGALEKCEEDPFLRADGTTDWVRWEIRPWHDAQGGIGGIILFSEVITERKRAEKEKRLSDELFSKAFHSSPAGILITRIADGTILDANESFLRMFEFSREEAIGRTSLELNMLVPEERSRLIRRQLDAGGLQNAELLSRAKSGRLLNLLFSSHPLELNGEACHITSLIDITERKQTEEALQQAHHRLQSLSHRLLEIQETERRQLARELHDEIGQALTATKINLQSLRKFPDPAALAVRLEDSTAIVERAIGQVRSLSLELRPPLLDDLGLGAALRWLFDQHSQRAGLRVDFNGGLLDTRFDGVVETAAFRVAQEALSNIVKHAMAERISVGLEVQDGWLHLRVRDDGAGFDVAARRDKASQGASLGLISMEERAGLAGGGIEWTSGANEGTEVHAWFALPTPPGGP